MEPERCTWGIWVITTSLGAAAIVFDDPSFLLATFSLVLLSAALAIRFQLRTQGIFESARVTRSADRKVVRQATTTVVTTCFSCIPNPRIQVFVTDIIPPTTIPDSQNTGASVSVDGTAKIRYSITPFLHGSIDFPGISLTVTDRFFKKSLVMGSDLFQGPVIEVPPRASEERAQIRGEFGGRETDAINIFPGYAVRSIREYAFGDDLRSVDWKMTAKYDRLYIREYTAVEDYPPLIVLDLPDKSFPSTPENLSKIVNAVTGEMEAAIRKYGAGSLLLISGVNIIDMILNENDINRCITVIRTSAHPSYRLHHAYRWKNRSIMRGLLKKIERAVSDPEDIKSGPLLVKIAQLYSKSLVNPEVPAFSAQVGRLLHSMKIEEVVIFSLLEGDVSHVREIVSQAQMLRISVKVRTVAGQGGSGDISIREALNTDAVEVIA